MSELNEILQDLIYAYHIIHRHGVVDAFGHISVRHPSKPDIFLMSANMAPALVRSSEDFVEYRVEDAQPVDNSGARKGFIERYIHSELFKKFPGVQSVIHCHAEEVLPYTISGVPFRPVGHMAGFLGQDVPIHDIEDCYHHDDSHDLLINSVRLGADLAAKFSSTETSNDFPNHELVLMRRHGFTTVSRNIKDAVYHAVLRHTFEGLTAQQMIDCESTTRGGIMRPWGLWVQEVKCIPLYTSKVCGGANVVSGTSGSITLGCFEK